MQPKSPQRFRDNDMRQGKKLEARRLNPLQSAAL